MAPGLTPLYNTVGSQEAPTKPSRFQELSQVVNTQLQLIEERTEALSNRLSGFMRPVPEVREKKERERQPDTPSALGELETTGYRMARISDRLGYLLDTLEI